VTGGLLADGYDPTRQAISELAREGAPTAPVLTAGLVGFGVLIPFFAGRLGRALDSPGLRTAITVAGVGTVGVAGFPLSSGGGEPQDLLHAVTAGAAYLGMALAPALGGRALHRRGHVRSAAASYAVSAVSAAALVGSVVVADGGLLQRVGLTVVDVWYAVAAVVLLARRDGRPALRPVAAPSS
jgi:hypothetical membrane protein